MQTLYRFKGDIETLAELNSKTDNTIGDVWRCQEDGNNYCWNKEEWINIGTDIDLSNYVLKSELEEDISTLEQTINELDPSMIESEATEVNDEDLLLVVQNGVKKKVPASKVGTGQGGATGDTLPVRNKSRV